jgi:hypothetical protein
VPTFLGRSSKKIKVVSLFTREELEVSLRLPNPRSNSGVVRFLREEIACYNNYAILRYPFGGHGGS